MLKSKPISQWIAIFAICLLFSDATKAEQNTKIVTLKSNGSFIKEIFNSKKHNRVGSVCYSPDGKKIAFDAWRSDKDISFVDSHIIVIDADGKNMMDLGDGAMPSWSPDSKKITFSRYKRESERQWMNIGVWIMDADGKNRTQLDREGWSSQWSPDGKKIAYTIHGKLVLYDTQTKKKEKVEFPDKEYFQFIYWNISWSSDSQLLAFKSRTSKSTHEIASIHLPSKDTVIHYSTNTSDRPLEDTAWHPSGVFLASFQRSLPKRNLSSCLHLIRWIPMRNPNYSKGKTFRIP